MKKLIVKNGGIFFALLISLMPLLSSAALPDGVNPSYVRQPSYVPAPQAAVQPRIIDLRTPVQVVRSPVTTVHHYPAPQPVHKTIIIHENPGQIIEKTTYHTDSSSMASGAQLVTMAAVCVAVVGLAILIDHWAEKRAQQFRRDVQNLVESENLKNFYSYKWQSPSLIIENLKITNTSTLYKNTLKKAALFTDSTQTFNTISKLLNSESVKNYVAKIYIRENGLPYKISSNKNVLDQRIVINNNEDAPSTTTMETSQNIDLMQSPIEYEATQDIGLEDVV